jgi:MFS superfamily sulfate permease-like transporter
MLPILQTLRAHIRFDRNELAGAFGDIGTDLPLIIGIIAASGADTASVLIVFGLMQIFSGVWYGMPMPVQPLKAFAAIVIAQKLPANLMYGGGLAIGIAMVLLSVSGAINWLARIVPRTVVRGIQLGLGFQLATLALKAYVPAAGISGYVLAGLGFMLTIVLYGNRKYPAALFIVAAGLLYAFIFSFSSASTLPVIAFRLPQWHTPTTADIVTGFLMLALPQIPLSLGNSILATSQVIRDYYPERAITVRKISFTYSLMNLVSPFLSGIPVCHGSGGMAGHYTFGARTGASVLIYGSLFLLLGLLFSQNFQQLVQVFPMPILGVLLFFEGLALTLLVKDVALTKEDLFITIMVALICLGLPYGYLIGLVVGTGLHYFRQKWQSKGHRH